MEVEVKTSSEQAVLIGRSRPRPEESSSGQPPQAIRPAAQDETKIEPSAQDDAARVTLSRSQQEAATSLGQRVQIVRSELEDSIDRLRQPGSAIKSFHALTEKVGNLVSKMIEHMDVARAAQDNQNPERVLQLTTGK